MKIAFMTGLSTATLFDANQSTQGSIIGGFLSVIGITLFFTSGLYIIAFKAIAESYHTFQVAKMPPFEDFSMAATQLISDVFFIAFKISAPVIIVGFLVYLAAGLMGRLMPSMQVFFILMPIQIYVGFLFLAMSLSAIMLVYLNFFEEKILDLF
jgi:flagellar biosynthetic protein FliR